eukprot:90731-Hanusia_phi.AAC.1
MPGFRSDHILQACTVVRVNLLVVSRYAMIIRRPAGMSDTTRLTRYGPIRRSYPISHGPLAPDHPDRARGISRLSAAASRRLSTLSRCYLGPYSLRPGPGTGPGRRALPARPPGLPRRIRRTVPESD